jgi:hypothetical protein
MEEVDELNVSDIRVSVIADQEEWKASLLAVSPARNEDDHE